MGAGRGDRGVADVRLTDGRFTDARLTDARLAEAGLTDVRVADVRHNPAGYRKRASPGTRDDRRVTPTRDRPLRPAVLSATPASTSTREAWPLLVPYFVAERAYGLPRRLGRSTSPTSLLSSLVQPLFGALTDRRALPWLLPLSTLTAGAGVALGGVTDSYPLTLAAVAAGGVGIAAYHPEAARAARAAAGGSHTAMGWFSLGGNVGFALAPPLVWAVVGGGGLGASWLLALPAVAGAVLCGVAVRSAGAARAAGGRTAVAAGSDDWASFLRLTGAVVCRSVVFAGLSTFVALYVRERVGGGSAAGTAALFVLYLGGAVGTVAGGRLADRYGRLRVVRRSYVLTVLAVAGVVLVPGPPVYLFVALTSAGLYVPFSLHITLGQDYLPRRVGTASGVTLGLAV
ncbi:membrane efflux protein, partial [Streptomyces lividans TK24]